MYLISLFNIFILFLYKLKKIDEMYNIVASIIIIIIYNNLLLFNLFRIFYILYKFILVEIFKNNLYLMSLYKIINKRKCIYTPFFLNIYYYAIRNKYILIFSYKCFKKHLSILSITLFFRIKFLIKFLSIN